ncbi:hypothetical protein BIW11_08510 [Tropilaelaps mercedesae]|uniref:Uncharacterized protein n=1 Tax=Tropilaelaps mercedesae TaxID=418985 RepID=A0A1V9XP82_9ACAR|nr:hypothetical protein BIW11_08510 [Tropilaelaps mercedesae]
MTESTQAPDVGAPMDTNNSSTNNETETNAVTEKSSEVGNTAKEERMDDTSVTKEGQAQNKGGGNTKVGDDKANKGYKETKPNESDVVKRKSDGDAKGDEGTDRSEGDQLKKSQANSNKDSASELTSAAESANDETVEIIKNNGDEKDSGGGDTVEKMELDQKEEPVADQKKRLIRESPCGNDCSNGCNGKFTEDQRVRVYDTYWGLASGSEVSHICELFL